jgi:hypothetical protein
VAEELGLDQLLGNRGAVHLDERLGGALALEMDLPRDELLAGAVLAGDQHPAVGRRRLRDLLLQALDRIGRAEDLVGTQCVCAEALVLVGEPAHLERVLDGEEDLLGGERLLDEVERPEPRRAHRGLDRAVPTHHDDGQLGPARPRLLEHRHAVATGHRDVEQHQIELLGVAAQRRQRGVAGGGRRDVVAFVGQQARERTADRFLVVDDQDAAHAPTSTERSTAEAGSSTMKRAPRGTASWTRT